MWRLLTKQTGIEIQKILLIVLSYQKMEKKTRLYLAAALTFLLSSSIKTLSAPGTFCHWGAFIRFPTIIAVPL